MPTTAHPYDGRANTVAAVTLAAAGAPLAEVAADAGQAGHIKTALLNLGNPEPGSPAHGAEPHTAVAGIELAIHNEHGLHARPAARFVETVRRFDAEVTVRNLTCLLYTSDAADEL